MVVSPAVADRLRLIDPVHVNAEFADQASDHDPLVALDCADETAPSLSLALSWTTLAPPNHKYVRVTATVSATDAHDPSPGGRVRVGGLVGARRRAGRRGRGDDEGRGRGGPARDERGGGRTYTITYRATDACGNAATRSATVTVPVR